MNNIDIEKGVSLYGKKIINKTLSIAFVLNSEMGYTQKEIATLMKVSQSTISNMIKEFEYQKQIYDLQQELNNAREIIQKQNLLPQNDTYFIE